MGIRLFSAHCHDGADHGRGPIISLDDADLAALIEARTADDKRDPLHLLRLRFNSLVM